MALPAGLRRDSPPRASEPRIGHRQDVVGAVAIGALGRGGIAQLGQLAVNAHRVLAGQVGVAIAATVGQLPAERERTRRAGRSCPWWQEVQLGFCLALAAGRRSASPVRLRPVRRRAVNARLQPLLDEAVALAARGGHVRRVERRSLVHARDRCRARRGNRRRPARPSGPAFPAPGRARSSDRLPDAPRGSRRTSCTWLSRKTGDLLSCTGSNWWATLAVALVALQGRALPGLRSFFTRLVGVLVHALAQIDRLLFVADGALLPHFRQLRAEAVVDQVGVALFVGLIVAAVAVMAVDARRSSGRPSSGRPSGYRGGADPCPNGRRRDKRRSCSCPAGRGSPWAAAGFNRAAGSPRAAAGADGVASRRRPPGAAASASPKSATSATRAATERRDASTLPRSNATRGSSHASRAYCLSYCGWALWPWSRWQRMQTFCGWTR